MRTIQYAAALCLVATSLAACETSSHLGPPLGSSPSARPTTSPPTSDQPPALPSAATAHTSTGAIAFVDYYWRAANYAQANLDPSPLTALFDKGCAGCRAAANGLRKLRDAQARVQGGITTISHEKTQALSSKYGHWMSVTYSMASTPESIKYPHKDTERYPGGEARGHMVLRQVAEGWVVSLIEVQ